MIYKNMTHPSFNQLAHSNNFKFIGFNSKFDLQRNIINKVFIFDVSMIEYQLKAFNILTVIEKSEAILTTQKG